MQSRPRARTWSVMPMFAALFVAAACGGGASPPASESQPAAYTELLLTPPALAGFVRVYVDEQVSKGEGWMSVVDPETGEELKLRLHDVHEGELAETEPGHFLVCADLVSDADVAYDLDFLLKKTERGVDVTDVLIHKVDGEARHDWVRSEDGYWVKQPA